VSLKKDATEREERRYQRYKEENLARLGSRYKAVVDELWYFAAYHIEDVPKKATLYKMMAKWFREWDSQDNPLLS